MTTDSNRALVERFLKNAIQEATTRGDTTVYLAKSTANQLLAALVPAQEVAGLVERIEDAIKRERLNLPLKASDVTIRTLEMCLAALSPPSQGAGRLELAAAGDNREALVGAVSRHVFAGALMYAFGVDARTTDRLTLEQREATIQRLSAEALAAFQSRQEGK